MTPRRSPTSLDGGDRACGDLLLVLAHRVRLFASGTLLRLVATDPAAAIDLPRVVSPHRHRYLGAGQQPDGRRLPHRGSPWAGPDAGPAPQPVTHRAGSDQDPPGGSQAQHVAGDEPGGAGQRDERASFAEGLRCQRVDHLGQDSTPGEGQRQCQRLGGSAGEGEPADEDCDCEQDGGAGP